MLGFGISIFIFAAAQSATSESTVEGPVLVAEAEPALEAPLAEPPKVTADDPVRDQEVWTGPTFDEVPPPPRPSVIETLPNDIIWDGKQVDVLGVDTTDFPNILMVVSLTEGDGIPLRNLNERQLRVTEDEAPQPVTEIAPCVPDRIPGDPLSLVLLIDSSGSMQNHIDVVQHAASRFVDRLRSNDEAAIVGFCNEPILLQAMTNKKNRMKKGIYKANPRGYTALYDSVDLAVRNLKDCYGRKAIVLLTDGRDDDGTGAVLSCVTLESVVGRARKAKVPIFTIGLGDGVSKRVLERMAHETVGEFFYAPSGQEVDNLYKEVSRQLGRGEGSYYAISYRSTLDDKDGTERSIIVQYAEGYAYAHYPAPNRLFWPLSKVF